MFRLCLPPISAIKHQLAERIASNATEPYYVVDAVFTFTLIKVEKELKLQASEESKKRAFKLFADRALEETRKAYREEALASIACRLSEEEAHSAFCFLEKQSPEHLQGGQKLFYFTLFRTHELRKRAFFAATHYACPWAEALRMDLSSETSPQ